MSYTIRQLAPADLPAVVALHQLILASNTRSEILRADSPEHFAANIEGAGLTLGAFQGEELVAYAAVALGGEAAETLVPHILGVNLSPERVAVHDGSGVHPAHRGHDLQDQLNVRRLEATAARGFSHVAGSVSVLNPYSLQNHFDFRFVVRGFARLYGGLDRAIIHRGPHPVVPRPIVHEVPFDQLGAHVDKLAAGFIGVALRRRGDVRMLCLQTDAGEAN